MMRNLQIMGTGLLGLIAAFWLALHPVQVLTAVALLPVLLLAAGQLYLPRSKRAIQVWFDPKLLLELSDGETIELLLDQHMRLSGKVLQPSYFKQWHEFDVVPHRYWLLLFLGTASVAAAGAIQWMGGGEFGTNGIGSIYLAASFWVVCVVTAWRWLRKRRALRMTGLALGSFSVVHSHRPGMRHIRYQFVDHEGEYRGGSFDSLFCDQSDDHTLVFYDEADPDLSVPASAMIFHKLVWKNHFPLPRASADRDSSAGGAA